MQRIREALQEVFPHFADASFGETMALGSIPDFDSMNSVNLQLSLESKFHTKLDDLPLNETTKISDIAAYLRTAGIDVRKEP